mgnify:CR=1 FL=1
MHDRSTSNASSISIHAPRVGSDHSRAASVWRFFYFNPRSPCGERPTISESWLFEDKFQSTLPVWGATCRKYRDEKHQPISIHAPRVGSDVVSADRNDTGQNFNPRSPCGERPSPLRAPAEALAISIHAPRVGSDAVILSFLVLIFPFQSTLPVWGATERPRPKSITW